MQPRTSRIVLDGSCLCIGQCCCILPTGRPRLEAEQHPQKTRSSSVHRALEQAADVDDKYDKTEASACGSSCSIGSSSTAASLTDQDSTQVAPGDAPTAHNALCQDALRRFLPSSHMSSETTGREALAEEKFHW
eukprot:TRINITY_DN8527_c0_g3_i4.p1 TRINITY_DN8527_c0_g3~~TRINITY_DN8527_c0_g3_i4.p1  ORF type:complete len:134 (-),score=21.86 TRINITY_DN8527_c0_g3_i4:126-527(-)